MAARRERSVSLNGRFCAKESWAQTTKKLRSPRAIPERSGKYQQKIWAKPNVLIEFRRLKERLYHAAMMSN
jgi:hypothetical protein